MLLMSSADFPFEIIVFKYFFQEYNDSLDPEHAQQVLQKLSAVEY